METTVDLSFNDKDIIFSLINQIKRKDARIAVVDFLKMVVETEKESEGENLWDTLLPIQKEKLQEASDRFRKRIGGISHEEAMRRINEI